MTIAAESVFDKIQPVKYEGGRLLFLDQTLLPGQISWIEIGSARSCADAIKRLALRGAPAIGIGAAFGLAVEARRIAGRAAGGGNSAAAGQAGVAGRPPRAAGERSCAANGQSCASGEPRCDAAGPACAAGGPCAHGGSLFYEELRGASELIAASRPTAVNLFWALGRMDRAAGASARAGEPPARAAERLLAEAQGIQSEDMAACRRIGEAGQEIIRDGMGILTHCNAGALATSRYGTALAPIYVAKERGLRVRVFADETRPLLQGARLTAYELVQAGIGVTLISDSMAASVMSQGWVSACIVGCDRVAANGDAANKIGTLGVAVLAKHFGIPFYVACPLSTLDMSARDGADIPIEQRGAEELTRWNGERIAPEGVGVYNPAFDVTPNGLVSGIITERGIARAPYGESLKALAAG
jgi:methylthioribose-1-phosphate isomerase